MVTSGILFNLLTVFIYRFSLIAGIVQKMSRTQRQILIVYVSCFNQLLSGKVNENEIKVVNKRQSLLFNNYKRFYLLTSLTEILIWRPLLFNLSFPYFSLTCNSRKSKKLPLTSVYCILRLIYF